MRFSVRFLTAIGLLAVSCGFAEVKPFTFVHISDTHIGVPGHETRLAEALQDIKTNFPDTAFIINTGDVTEAGYDEQYTSYTEIIKKSPVKIYPVVGNHDARWSESGKENFKEHCGPTYISFEYNGVHFYLLDVAMLIEQYGHFDGQQVEKLKAELAKLGPDEPAVLACHHPPLSTGHYIDNEYEMAELLRHYNVPLFLDGHGHGLPRWTVNGTTYAMGGSTSNGGAPSNSYRIYHVYPDHIDLQTRVFSHNRTRTEEPVQLNVPKSQVGELKQIANENSDLAFELETSGSAKVKSGSYTLDKALTGTLVQVENGLVHIDPQSLNPGRHQIVEEFVDDEGSTEVRTAYFETELSTAPKILRHFDLKSGVQAHPVIDGDTLYVASNDTYVRSFDLNTGKLNWEKSLNREILSSPAIVDDSIVVGSLDTHVYCLNKQDGSVKWDFPTKGAVMATPLIQKQTVYVGSGDYHMYALNLKNGKLKWKFAAEKLIKATPAFAKGRLYFGAWDNRFYCLDAKTGSEVWNVPASTSAHFSAATFNPVAVDNKIIVTTHDYSVRCLDQGVGSHIWLYKPTKDELGPSYSSAVIDGGVAYMGSINGHVVGHDLDTGEKVFDVDVRPAKTDPLFDSIPLLVNGKIFVGSVGGNLYCVDVAGKRVDWSVSLQPGYIFTRPVAWKDHILVGTLDNKVYEIGPVTSGQ
jgi:outer membrane protein assembly factor BamB